MTDRPRILVKEKIADAGVDLLSERFDVDIGTDWARTSSPSDRRLRRDRDPFRHPADRGAVERATA